METWGKEHRAPLEGSFEGRLVKLEQGFALENSSRNEQGTVSHDPYRVGVS